MFYCIVIKEINCTVYKSLKRTPRSCFSMISFFCSIVITFNVFLGLTLACGGVFFGPIVADVWSKMSINYITRLPQRKGMTNWACQLLVAATVALYDRVVWFVRRKLVREPRQYVREFNVREPKSSWAKAFVSRGITVQVTLDLRDRCVPRDIA